MERSSSSLRVPMAVLAMTAFLWSACSNGSGCMALTPLPQRYSGPKTDNAVSVRVTSDGLGFINDHWQPLLEIFAPGQKLDFPLCCMIVDAPVIGKIALADQGDAQGSGKYDGKCDGKDAPKIVSAKITAVNLQAQSPDSVSASLSLEIDTGKVFLSTLGKPCLGLDRLECSFDLNTGRDASPRFNSFKAQAQFTIDMAHDKLLRFSVATLDGAKVCGASGALSQPFCLEPSDIDIDGNNLCGKTVCEAADIGFLKSFLLERMSPMLESKIRDAIRAQSCEPAPKDPSCQTPAGQCSTACQSTPTQTEECVPRFLGIEGKLAAASLLSSFGIPSTAELELSVAAGAQVSADTGLNVGTRGGVQATAAAECVPLLPDVGPVADLSAPAFDSEAPGGMAYHVGLGISRSFLDTALRQAYKSGALCLSLSSDTIPLLDTRLFKTLVPSLGALAERDGKPAPMRVDLRPKTPPVLKLGAGTTDVATSKPIDPLIQLELKDLAFDVSVLIEDRFVRLFTLTADIAIPLSLVFQGCDSVQPVLGNLQQVITNIRTTDSELLAEDTAVLKDLVPTLIGFAEPALGQALKPFQLPTLAGFKLRVLEAKGLSRMPSGGYDHLGLFAEFLLADQACGTMSLRSSASLKRNVTPQSGSAVLEVNSQGGDGPSEFAVRVDDGLWTDFRAPSASGELEVTHARLRVQGAHRIEVRARSRYQPRMVSVPTPVDFVVDHEPPEVSFRVNPKTLRVETSARDAVTSQDKLLFAYRLGSGAQTAFGAASEFALADVEQQGELEVQVKDAAGLVGTALYRVPVVHDEAGLRSAGLSDAVGVGCSTSTGAGALWLAWLTAGVLWQSAVRRRRS